MIRCQACGKDINNPFRVEGTISKELTLLCKSCTPLSIKLNNIEYNKRKTRKRLLKRKIIFKTSDKCKKLKNYLN